MHCSFPLYECTHEGTITASSMYSRIDTLPAFPQNPGISGLATRRTPPSRPFMVFVSAIRAQTWVRQTYLQSLLPPLCRANRKLLLCHCHDSKFLTLQQDLALCRLPSVLDTAFENVKRASLPGLFHVHDGHQNTEKRSQTRTDTRHDKSQPWPEKASSPGHSLCGRGLLTARWGSLDNPCPQPLFFFFFLM